MFKLNSSELKKMFLRPAIYVMLVILSIVLVVSALIYHPVTRNNTESSFGGGGMTVSAMMTAFENGTTVNSKKVLDQNLEDAKQVLENFSKSTSVKTALQTEINKIYRSLTVSESGTLRYALLQYSTQPQTAELRTAVEDAVLEIRNNAESLYTVCVNINSNDIDIYISSADISTIKNFGINFYHNWPNEESLSEITDRQLFVTTIENLCNKYTPQTASVKEIIDSAETINVSAETINSIVNKYYTAIAYAKDSTTTLTTIYGQISQYVNEHADETSEQCTNEFNALTTKYRNAADIACNLILNTFNYEKIGNYSNAEIKNFYGFEDFNYYKINEEITLNKYLLDNQIFDGKYLVSFNFNTTSGYSESAYDFCVYAMQILSIVLTVFAMFFMTSIIAGDFQNGSMKMLATRPLTRSQIISGKTLACINFTLIFAIFALIASLAVGYAMFGFGDAYSVLTVFNATSVVAMPPALLLFIYFVSLMLNIIFFIVLASFFAVIFRSTASSLFVTLIIYVAGIILSALLSGASWFVFTPFAYLDLFKYFGGSVVSGGFLTFATPQIAILIALIVYFVLVFIFSLLSKLIFQKRDIT